MWVDNKSKQQVCEQQTYEEIQNNNLYSEKQQCNCVLMFLTY